MIAAESGDAHHCLQFESACMVLMTLANANALNALMIPAGPAKFGMYAEVDIGASNT